jgi:CubicO group peptidase (beta-lactamase class C family)
MSTVGDLFTFARAVSENRLVSEETLGQMLVPLSDSTFLEGEHYGYGWFIGELDGHAFFEHPGYCEGYATRMMMFPDDEVTTIVLSNWETDSVWDIAADLAKQTMEGG